MEVTVDLSRNESPFPLHPRVRSAVVTSAAGANRYPEYDCRTLRAAIAESSGVGYRQVVVGPGSVSVLQDLVTLAARRRGRALLVDPDFEVYRQQVDTMGLQVDLLSVGGRMGDRNDWADPHVPPDTRLVLFSNPNNPTGASLTCTQVVRILRAVPHQALVVIDEAYREFASEATCRDATVHARSHPGLVVVRTFSKAFGLAGLRVGYAIVPDGLDEGGLLQRPYPVSGLAVAAARAALEVKDEIGADARALTGWRETLRAQIAALGVTVAASDGNFLWLPLSEQGHDLTTHLATHGIAVREVRSKGVRVTVGSPQENAVLLAALTEWAASTAP
jgi:histidinol-phosphate aminotransferase